MIWQFSILNRNNVETIIDEPEGWDAMKITVKRDLDTHGIFFDFQGNDFTFDGEAYAIIKDEYDTYGVEGNLVMIIRQDCGKGPIELYRGRLLFTQYKYLCGDGCTCKIPIEQEGQVMQVRNKWDQAVDLETTTSFNGYTALLKYDYLGKKIELKSKGIYVQNDAVLTGEKSLTVNLSDIGFINAPTVPDIRHAWFNIIVPFDQTNMGEFGNFAPSSEIINNFVCYGANSVDTGCPDLIVWKGGEQPPGSGNFYRTILFDWATAPALMYYNKENPNNLDFIDSFNIHASFQCNVAVNYASSNTRISAWHNMIVKRKADGSYELLDNDVVLNTIFEGPTWTSQHDISYDRTIENVTLSEGEYLFLVIGGQMQFWTGALETGEAFTLTFYEAAIKADTMSYSASSLAKMFMVNESLSRVTEAITDDNVRVYSEFFGRKDSQPYSVEQDGCGSLVGISKGLFIRGQDEKNGEKIVFATSLKDLFEGLNPIFNIGCGFEPDPIRPGYKCLRFENWQYFYKTDVLMVCDGVAKIEGEIIESDHYSTFSFGYEKWEAEEFNGLDEFLTKRKYRTTLNQVKNELSRLSKLVASGYAIEITRRKGNYDSKDWRYDNDTFVVCMKRGVYDPQEYLVSIRSNAIKLLDITDIPEWAIPGATIQISGSVDATNNDLFVIVRAAKSLGIVWVFINGLAPRAGDQMIVITPQDNPNTIQVERGGISSPHQLIDPATIYNFRIRPVANAMRWTDKLFSSYRTVDEESKAIFMDGEGNYFASGLMDGACVQQLVAMAENETIDLSKFKDADEATPLLRPERISFTYPMTLAQFKGILANPYGIIGITDSCVEDAGWIDEIIYSPNEGSATFKLIPGYPTGKLLLTDGIFTNAFGQQME